MQNEHTQLVRGLGLIAAISVNVANIIGTGVFLKARVITCNVGTPGKALMVWVFAGLLSLAGALTYAELLAMMPRAAGEYGIIRDAYGRPLGFISGWTQFLIARAASAAALAVGFAIFLNDLLGGVLRHDYLSYTLPGGHVLAFGRLQVVALAAIVITTLINCAAVSFSGGVASVLTGMKIVLLVALGLGAFFYGSGDWGNLGLSNVGGACENVPITTGGMAGLAAAMLGALWAYDGWNNITFLAGEVKNPARNLPLALIGGGFLVMGLYLFVTVNYTHVPIRALVVQCVWACVVALSGSYDNITDYAIFALTLFYALVAASVFIFRRRLPDAERTYRVWGYPFVPVIFVIVCCWLIFQTIYNTPHETGIGLFLILLGVPVYYILDRRRPRST